MNLQILYEDEWIIGAVKPQGVPAQADKTGDADLLSMLEAHVGHSLGLLHRLDRPVGGVMLFAKDKETEATLAKDLQEKRLNKKYLTVLCGRLPAEQGTLENYLLKNARTNLSEVVSKDRKGGKKAILHYRRLAEKESDMGILTLAEITLETGRHHQIRVQTSHAGFPIWGDRKYHKTFPKKGKTEIALWSYRLEGTHPATKKTFLLTAKPEKEPFSLFVEELREL
ncbi:MAG: RluA family pseudouridine synthase [Bacillota bacterium]|nr:RluA family pseudouridine synthase [Bacillota bacterium]